MSAPVDFKAIAASLPKRQRAAYRVLINSILPWVPAHAVARETGDTNALLRLNELEGKRLVELRYVDGGAEWRAVPQVVTGREHLLHLLRGLKALVDNPPPVFALSEEQSKLLDEVNAVLSEGTKR